MDPIATAVAADPASVIRKGDNRASEVEEVEDDVGRYGTS